MQYSWLAIALLALVVILGVVVGIRQSASTIQRQATMLSLAVLAIMGIISCVVAPLLGLGSLFPVFALLSFILPLIVYAGIISTAGKTAPATTARDLRAGSMSPAHAKLARKKPLIISLKEEEDEEVVSASEEGSFIAPVGQEANKQKSAQQAPVKPSFIPAAVPTVDKEVLMTAFGDEHVDKAPARQSAPAVSYPPPLGEVKAARAKATVASETPTQVEPAPAPAPVEAAPAVIVPLKSVIAPVSASESAVSAAVSAPAPVVTATPVSIPASAAPTPEAPAPAPVAEPTFATCFAKATALKEKGAYAVAARLFAKGAALSESGADGHRARFEEITCYVKADQPDRARALASEMREQATTMTKVERIKLDAIARML